MELTNEQVMDLVQSTVKWADEVSEMWAGTQYSGQIDAEKYRLLTISNNKDFGLMQSAVFDLAHFLSQAEAEYERADELQEARRVYKAS